jgi:anti-anti-sigma factor
MPLSVTSTIEDNFAILELSGPLTLSPSLTTLRQIAKEALSANRLAGMILRVSGVTMADSAGVGELTVVYTFANRSGCPLMLADVPPGLRNILEITRLDALLPAAENVEAAKKNLKM